MGVWRQRRFLAEASPLAAGRARTEIFYEGDAGAHAESHAHDQTEQIFVVVGTFYDQTRTYQAGDYVSREPGTNPIAGSTTGATVLVVYTP
ncbi:cupin domain-containing protein [Sinorhizobium medicae]|uniref:cupin domain-containing protein n=1 Tax=Sinorhizobium medicae TaxID=110321 RepID=UPI001F19A8F1|nr:cupin domain-containing protein [Sinorhizobium medicae]